LAERIRNLEGWTLVLDPDLDVVCWHANGTTASAVSAATDAAYAALEARGWHVAKLVVASDTLGLETDQPTTTILRSALMKPEHLGVVDAFADALATLDCR
jgi:hypothetical protein